MAQAQLFVAFRCLAECVQQLAPGIHIEAKRFAQQFLPTGKVVRRRTGRYAGKLGNPSMRHAVDTVIRNES